MKRYSSPVFKQFKTAFKISVTTLVLNAVTITNSIASPLYENQTSAANDSDLINITEIAINVGGRKYTSIDQDKYIADTYSNGGIVTDINSVDIKNSEDDTLFLSERYGNFSYNIPIDNGMYDVTLLYAELIHQTPGARAFSVNIENNNIVENLDLFEESGFHSAYSTTASDIVITDNTLTIELTSVTDNAKLSAIRITRKVLANDDEDHDGVINSKDSCFYTPREDAPYVDAQGCSPYEIDSDDDGVIDPYDACVTTPASELVDWSGCSLSQKDNDNDGISDDIDQCDYTPLLESVDNKGCGIYSEAEVTDSPFREFCGLVVIEMESTNYSEGWKRFSGNYSSGNGYLQWMGNDYFQTPGNGLINISVHIQTPGTYKFLWLNSIKKGNSSTDHNDSWLKIVADSFYGIKPDGHIVCPREQDSANDCVGDDPRGSSSAGWFKIFRFSGPITEWFWRAKTSDSDGHDIYARFDSPGIYNIQISARSAYHAIDRLVLFRTGNSEHNIEEDFATSLDRYESFR